MQSKTNLKTFNGVEFICKALYIRGHKGYVLVSDALLLKYSKAADRWTGCETSVYVGELLQVAVKGGQRQAFRIQYLHQEQMLAGGATTAAHNKQDLPITPGPRSL